MLIDITGQSRINENDIIVFKNGKWTTVQKGEFLGEVCKIMNEQKKALENENKVLTEQLKELNTKFDHFKIGVNEKLKEHHNALKTLTGAKK